MVIFLTSCNYWCNVAACVSRRHFQVSAKWQCTIWENIYAIMRESLNRLGLGKVTISKKSFENSCLKRKTEKYTEIVDSE